MTYLDLDLKDRNIHAIRSFTVSTIPAMCSVNSAVADMVTPRSFVDDLASILVFAFEMYDDVASLTRVF